MTLFIELYFIELSLKQCKQNKKLSSNDRFIKNDMLIVLLNKDDILLIVSYRFCLIKVHQFGKLYFCLILSRKKKVIFFGELCLTGRIFLVSVLLSASVEIFFVGDSCDHVIMWSQGQWEAPKRCAPHGADRHPYRQTNKRTWQLYDWISPVEPIQ